jgi:allantoin racemase
VLDCEDETSRVFDAFVAEATRAIEEDHAEAIILGCAGLEPLVGALADRLRVPVIEGVAAAVKMVEALLAMRLTTSKTGAWGYPLPKPITGPAASFVSPTRDKT